MSQKISLISDNKSYNKFKFKMYEQVICSETSFTGEVVARTEFADDESKYLVKEYDSDKYDSSIDWFKESDLTKVTPNL